MVTLLVREFTVHVPLETAWQHLARIEQWPSWARHIRQIELTPPGELGPSSTGVIHLRGGMKSAFRMTDFHPPRNWTWVGRILWMTVSYDHQFEAHDSDRTKLTWVVQAQGLGESTIGRLFAALYRRDMDRAIERLIREMEALSAGV
jgi:carbon monoxide dehydrogenase subunit G